MRAKIGAVILVAGMLLLGASNPPSVATAATVRYYAIAYDGSNWIFVGNKFSGYSTVAACGYYVSRASAVLTEYSRMHCIGVIGNVVPQ